MRGLLLIPVLVITALGAGPAIKGRVITNDNFPGSDCIIKLLQTGVSDTTDSTGSFLLALPPSVSVKGATRMTPPIINDRVNSRLLLSNTRAGGFRGQGIVGLSGRTIRELNVPAAGSGIFLFNPLGNNNTEKKRFLGKSAVAFVDTLVVSYCDSIQKKVAVSIVDTEKQLQITLSNDLAPKRHRFLAASFSNNAAYVISATNTLEATYKMPGTVQDAWRLANGHILLSGGDSVREFDAGGKVIWGYKSPCGGEMHNCQPLQGGKRFFGENCSGKIFIADSLGTTTAVPNIQLKDLSSIGGNTNHARFRMARKYDSLFLITAMGEGVVYLFNTRGDTLRKINNATVSRFGVTFNAVHSAILLPNGNILIGSGYTGFFIEVDKKDSVVWKTGAADLPSIGLVYAAGCQRLHNGNTVCATYESTVKFFEITHKKHLVWTSNAGGVTGNPTHIFLLDIAGDPAKGDLLR